MLLLLLLFAYLPDLIQVSGSLMQLPLDVAGAESSEDPTELEDQMTEWWLG